MKLDYITRCIYTDMAGKRCQHLTWKSDGLCHECLANFEDVHMYGQEAEITVTPANWLREARWLIRNKIAAHRVVKNHERSRFLQRWTCVTCSMPLPLCQCEAEFSVSEYDAATTDYRLLCEQETEITNWYESDHGRYVTRENEKPRNEPIPYSGRIDTSCWIICPRCQAPTWLTISYDGDHCHTNCACGYDMFDGTEISL